MLELFWAILGAGLVLYAVTGGADFGGGVWDLAARGPRKAEHRALIAHAIGPIWETNHIWLIFVIVTMFSVFPLAFAFIGIALHVPITVALVGIVLRGAAFVFRSYGLSPPATQALWGRVFAFSSLITPLALGACLAALSSGDITLGPTGPTSPLTAGWATLHGLVVGLFCVSLFAMLAATYLAAEADDAALADDFRARALGAEIVAGALSFLTLASSSTASPLLFANLARAWPLQAIAGALALVTMALLVKRRFGLARLTAPLQVACVVIGWGLAMDGHLVLPALPLAAAGSDPRIHGALLRSMIAGAVLLVPSLVLLFRVFKRRAPAGPPR